MPGAHVEISGLHKSYAFRGRRIDVLRGIDLRVAAGDMVAVVGASGVGKSTFLHVLGTLDRPTSGRMVIDKLDVTQLDAVSLAAFRNRTIGFVFQFHHLLPEFTALENAAMPGLISGLSREQAESRAEALLKRVELGHRLLHRPGELSGGEQQRVALARALVMEPKLILADEPTGNLDSKTSDAMNDLFFDLNRRRGTTFLVVTHSRDLAGQMPRVVTMRDGRIESDERRVVPPRAGETQAEAHPETEATA